MTQDGMISWAGGRKPPVSEGTIVQVWLRGGSKEGFTTMVEATDSPDFWEHVPEHASMDIVGYKVIK